MTRTNVFNDGRIYVQSEMCSTCIFRAGNRMALKRGRVREMVDGATAVGGVIPCHQTILGQRGQESICRGYYDLHAPLALELAAAMDLIEFTEPDKKGEDDGRGSR